jgi:AraC-like DNA-binding protein/uncharacterized protein YxeA
MKTTEKGILPKSEVFFSTPGSTAKKIFFYIICTGLFIYEDSYMLKRDNYNSFLIMFIQKGKSTIFYDDKSFNAKAGDVVFLDCHKMHGYKSDGELQSLWFHFDGNMSSEYFNLIYENRGCVITLNNSYSVQKYMYEIYNSYKAEKPINEALISAYISRILSEFFTSSEQTSDNEISIIEKAINYINNHYDNTLTLKNLAQNVNLSPFYFTRFFKKETGYTPYEYIIKTRLNNAKILLKTTDLSIKEIAFKCGFTTESSFINCFKKNTLITPGHFRKTML